MAECKNGHVFVIAEIGSNHNQNIEQAFQLMDIAKQAGADAVKFQSLKLDELIAETDIRKTDIELFQKIELREEWYDKIFAYAQKINMECISTPTYLQALELLKKYNVKHIKIASPQTYGFPELIKKTAQLKIDTIMSTGYCEEEEIKRAVNLFETYGDLQKLTLLHCTSQYPTEPDDANLNFLKTLKNRYGTAVGYSDHTLGTAASVAAVCLGASVIEKHLTLSRKMEGPDHYFALEPDDFKKMVSDIRETEKLLGMPDKKLTDFEREFRENIIMYPYSARAMQQGEKLAENDITYFRSRSKGISPWNVEQRLLGKALRKSVPANHQLKETELAENERDHH